MGASPARVFFRVVMPSALPEIAGGLRIAISIALVVIVVTEMFIGTASGLGKRIFQTYQLFQIPEMFAAILLTGLFGYALNLLLLILERRLIHWGGR
jgi:NitT/TauT family transport system permease protein